ncbi:MAG: hypothetical protein V1743_05140 [Nanoarchaeota archaeon]
MKDPKGIEQITIFLYIINDFFFDMRVLFVCMGNRGRSQIAEAYFNAYYSPNHHAISAGLHAETYNHNPVPQSVKDIMLEDGIDISHQRSKQLEEIMLDAVEKIVVFCPKESWPTYLLLSNKTQYWPSQENLEQAGIDALRKTREEIKSQVRTMPFPQ